MAKEIKLGKVVGAGVPVGGATGQILTKKSNADYDAEWRDNSSGGVLAYQGIGLVVLGDSISVFAGSTVTAISSDSNGTVTITCSLSPAAKVGEMISINFVEPAEFNGHFRVESVAGSTYTVKNDKVAKNTTGTVMSGFLNRFACNLAQLTPNWVTFGQLFALNRPPLKAVIAQSSIGTQPFIDNFDKLVKPREPEYVVNALGANDVGTTEAHLNGAIEKCKTLLNLIISAGMKPIASLIAPRRIDSTSAVNTHKYNQWLKAYCLSKGIPFINFYGALVDQKDGGTPSGYMTDAVHPNMDGHYRMGEEFAETMSAMFTEDMYLPETSYENFANGYNLFDDPLMVGAAITSAEPGVTGTHLSETKVTRAGTGSTAVASIVPRADGFGNNIRAVADIPTFAQGSSRVQISTSRLIEIGEEKKPFTADRDYYLMPMFSGYAKIIEEGTLEFQRAMYAITVNGISLNRNMFTVQASNTVTRVMDDKEIVLKGTPIVLKAGDVISGTVSITHAIYGSGKFELEMGRVAFRLIPAERFVY